MSSLRRAKRILLLKAIAGIFIWGWDFLRHEKASDLRQLRPLGLLLLWLATFLAFLGFMFLLFVKGPPRLPQDPFGLLSFFGRNPGSLLAVLYIVLTVVRTFVVIRRYKEEIKKLETPKPEYIT